jgi:hypothetical protein
MYASENGHEEVVVALLKKKADHSLRNKVRQAQFGAMLWAPWGLLIPPRACAARRHRAVVRCRERLAGVFEVASQSWRGR